MNDKNYLEQKINKMEMDLTEACKEMDRLAGLVSVQRLDLIVNDRFFTGTFL